MFDQRSKTNWKRDQFLCLRYSSSSCSCCSLSDFYATQLFVKFFVKLVWTSPFAPCFDLRSKTNWKRDKFLCIRYSSSSSSSSSCCSLCFLAAQLFSQFCVNFLFTFDIFSHLFHFFIFDICSKTYLRKDKFLCPLLWAPKETSFCLRPNFSQSYLALSTFLNFFRFSWLLWSLSFPVRVTWREQLPRHLANPAWLWD